jgi:hypothetical protein
VADREEHRAAFGLASHERAVGERVAGEVDVPNDRAGALFQGLGEGLGQLDGGGARLTDDDRSLRPRRGGDDQHQRSRDGDP